MNEEKVKTQEKSEKKDEIDKQVESTGVIFEEKSFLVGEEESGEAFGGSKVRFFDKGAEFNTERAAKEKAWYRKLAQTLGLDIETVRIHFVRERVAWWTTKDEYNDFINEGGTNNRGGPFESG